MLLQRLFSLPPALLGLILMQGVKSDEQELEWPYNLPRHMKYYPEDEIFVKRIVQIQKRLEQQTPVGMRKMSGDPGEKFMLDYWQFEETIQEYGNATIVTEVTAPLQLHGRLSHDIPILPRNPAARLFDKRAYECPAGSYACTSIQRPDSCCGDGSTCQLTQDVGLGDVGCCPENEVCGGSVSSCPGGGYTNCPQNPGGGCCLPGYACDGVGCIQVSTAVVVITPSTSRSSTTPSSLPSSSATSSGTTVIAPPPVASSTQPPSTTAAPSTSTQPNTIVCSYGIRSCPLSRGCVCCPTDTSF